MDMADRLLAALAGGVSHRVTGPLASVVANLGFALDTLAAAAPGGPLADGEGTQELGRALRDAQRAADAIRLVLRDLAVFARPPGDRTAAVDLGHLLESAISVAEAGLDGRARVQAALPEGLLVPGSEARLGRCLLQILLDALEPAGAGGPEHAVRVSARREGPLAVVEVEGAARPAGPGEEGGPGLLGCHVLVAAMGGHFIVTPGAGDGRRVRLELPST